MKRERTQCEREKFHDVERAGLVLGVIALVFALVFLAVHDVVLDEKTTPGMVAVAAQQRVVEVEDRESQFIIPMKPQINADISAD